MAGEIRAVDTHCSFNVGRRFVRLRNRYTEQVWNPSPKADTSLMRRVLSLLCMFTAAAFCVSAQSSDAIVGKWHVTGSNAEFEVSPSPTTAGQFRITLLNADDMSIMPGTVIGSAHTTPTPGRYVASMAASPSRPKGKQRKLVITIKANGSLGFDPFRTRRINVRLASV